MAREQLLVILGILFASQLAPRCTGCAFCKTLSQQRLQLQQLQAQQHQHQQLQLQQGNAYRTIGSPRPFGGEKPTRVQEFNRTGVLHPEYQIPATLRPGNVSQFYYLSPREGPPLTLLVSPCSGPISWTVSYVEPPENTQEADGTKSQTRWPVKTLKPGSPLFAYEGAEDQNFTISETRAGLYWFEMKSVESTSNEPPRHEPSTVLLYATSSNFEQLPSIYATETLRRYRALRFQQRRSRRRLTVSWNKSHVDPHLSNYCLAVTSGAQAHPATLCAAKNVLKVHPCVPKGSTSSKERQPQRQHQHQHRGIPEGLHCIRQTKLTLHRMKYDTTYNFTLYVVNMRNNVSNRVATDAIRFRRTPELTLRTGRYTTTTLRKTDGFVNFRYRPPDNTSTIFHILPCGGGIVKAKLTATKVLMEKEVVGYGSIRAPILPSGRMFTLKVSATPQELTRLSAIKVLATQQSSALYPRIPSIPMEYTSMTTCHEITVGVEPAGAAKYCILARELGNETALSGISTVPDQCGLHRRRRSQYTVEICEEKKSPPKGKALPFTLTKLNPGKVYLLLITAQLKGKSLSYPLLAVKTKRICEP